MARYEGDQYHRASDDTTNVPGNPWVICTLWLAEWKIAKAKTVEELQKSLPIFQWVVDRALASGVLPEQVHPHTSGHISVSPLTWSHAAVVAALEAYLSKLDRMSVCQTCGQRKVGRTLERG